MLGGTYIKMDHPWQNVPRFQAANRNMSIFTQGNLPILTQTEFHKPLSQFYLMGIPANNNNAITLARRAYT